MIDERLIVVRTLRIISANETTTQCDSHTLRDNLVSIPGMADEL